MQAARTLTALIEALEQHQAADGDVALVLDAINGLYGTRKTGRRGGRN